MNKHGKIEESKKKITSKLKKDYLRETEKELHQLRAWKGIIENKNTRQNKQVLRAIKEYKILSQKNR